MWPSIMTRPSKCCPQELYWLWRCQETAKASWAMTNSVVCNRIPLECPVFDVYVRAFDKLDLEFCKAMHKLCIKLHNPVSGPITKRGGVT